MPGNGDCISRGRTDAGPTRVCQGRWRHRLAGAEWLQGAGVNSAPSASLCLTRGHPSSPWQSAVPWTCSSGSCMGSFGAAFSARAAMRAGSPGQERQSPLSRSRLAALRFPGTGRAARSRNKLHPPACPAPGR